MAENDFGRLEFFFFFYKTLPNTEASMAAPAAAVKVILVDGAPLIVMGLQLSDEQQVITLE